MSDSRSSMIWKYFTVNDSDCSKATCGVCSKSISRGGKDRASWGLKGLLTHLGTHTAQFASLKKAQKAQESKKRQEQELASKKAAVRVLSPSSSQPSLEDSLVKVWDINDSKSQELIRKIGEFICIDSQPLSVVEDVGFARLLKFLQPRFRCPNRTYFMEVVIPSIYTKVKSKISTILSLEPSLSFTTDIWSSLANDAYVSLTGHFVTSEFLRKEVAIACTCFPGEHTGVAVVDKIRNMLADNSLSDKCHCFLRDSGTNMVAAFQQTSINNVPCLSHVIQNAIKEGLLKGEQPVSRMLDRARSVVGHFKHSPKATDRFRQMQKTLMSADKHHALIQSEPTRWNTDYYMLERLVEQREPVSAALANGNFASLRDDQWELAGHVVELLAPFENITKKLSQQDASVSQVIPFVEVLKKTLSRGLASSDYLRDARQKMLEDDYWDPKSDPLEFWRSKSKVYEQLAQLERRYLAPPPSSVASERLFSTTGQVCSPSRNRLNSERLEMLVFLSKNIQAVDFYY